MLQWIKDYIYYTIYSGPARNAPNDGVNIKKFIENKPSDVKLISGQDLLEAKNKLKTNDNSLIKVNTFFSVTPKELINVKCQLKTNTNIKMINKNNTPLMEEFNTVFKMGYKNYFEQRKLTKY